ncbi:hypothetical protein DEO72_LG10g1195 [Vigna unguiculata]|uniref:Uncharacterized protein n=1 Tax=Vigna unguiculata TaxID=3917 RepID=A0A4D6NAQ5_VIGUN|nr:hypothetical protein DEO72_LG10g1195 [Vigna unguiculata]
MDAMNMIDWVLKLFTWDVHCNVWRLTAGCALPDDVCEMVGLEMTRRLVARSDPPGGLGRFRLTVLGPRQAIHGWWLTCDDMSGEVHIQLLSRGDTSEVRRAGLRAGRFVEQDYERGAFGLRSWPRTNSPFLFVYGDDHDRVIRYTGADVDTGDVEDAQATT